MSLQDVKHIFIAGTFGNHIDPAMACQAENLDALRARLAGPCLGAQPFVADPARAVAAHEWLVLPKK